MKIETLGHLPRFLAQGLLDVLLPPQCAGCGALLPAARPPLCDRCRELLEPAAGGHCLRCGSSCGAGDLLCLACRHFGPLGGLRAVWQFGGPLAEAVWVLKRAGPPALVDDFAEALAGLYRQCGWQATGLVPVPMHRRRFAARGFNPAALLARRLGEKIALPLRSAALERRRCDRPQVSLSGRARRQNLVGAFYARPPLEGALCLVDDVVTTGSTLLACAEALRAAGAPVVYALSLAETPMAD